MNKYRWYEYSLSSSLIISLMFVNWGNFDWVQVSGVFLINMCTIMFGDEFETLNSGRAAKDVNWWPFYYGTFTGLVTWGVMWGNIFTDDDVAEYPLIAWVYLIVY